MFYNTFTFIGIDPTAGQRPMTYAALDGDLCLLALGQGNLEDVLAFSAGQRQAFIAISAPRQPNLGLMDRPEVRSTLYPAPRPGRWSNSRVAEYLLRQHNISAPQTPGEAAAAPNWMQMGFTLYQRLGGLDYQTYPGGEATRQLLEVYPHASFTAWMGRAPFPKQSLTGRLQRQLMLYERRINITDPMRFFEEITRHKLLLGKLPEDVLNSPAELDALAAAYSAWLAATSPDRTTLLGHPEEGQIVLPVPELKARYDPCPSET